MKEEPQPLHEVWFGREGIVITRSEAEYLVQWRLAAKCFECSNPKINRVVYHPQTVILNTENSSIDAITKEWDAIKEALKNENILG